MKKTVIFLSLASLFFQNLPMDHRVDMKKMHEQYQKQLQSYKVAEQKSLKDKSRATHHQSLIADYAGSGRLSKKFVATTLLCSMLVTASALSYKACPCKTREYKGVEVTGWCLPIKNSTTVYDDGKHCYRERADCFLKRANSKTSQHPIFSDLLYPLNLIMEG